MKKRTCSELAARFVKVVGIKKPMHPAFIKEWKKEFKKCSDFKKDSWK